ncbi:hypothetical protein ACMFMG_007789 [Clarireedia jacksonii]
MPRRTRANPSPGGLKSLDDVVPKKKGRKAAVKVQQSIESVETISNTTKDEASLAVAYTQSQSSPPTTSRSYSPESRSQSPVPIESRSTSPPAVTTATSNDASSDNDVTTQRQSQRLTPLPPSRKRSRVEEPVTPTVGTPEGKEEVKEQKPNKRARKSVGDSRESSAKSDRSERESQEKGSDRRSTRKTERQSSSRKSTPTRSQPRGRRQPESQVNPESSSEEVTEKLPSPVRVRSKSTSKPNNVATSRSPRQVQENTPAETKQATQPEHVSAGPSQPARAAPKLTLPAPSLKPAPQHVSTLPPLKASDIPTDPDERMEFAAKRYGFQPITFGANFKPYPQRAYYITPRSKSDLIRAKYLSRGIIPKEAFSNDKVDEAQIEHKKKAAASSSETLSTSEIDSAARRSEEGLLLTDPYLVTVAQAFTTHKDQSKPLPTIEEIQAFLEAYQSQDAAEKVKSQSIVKSSQQPSSSKTDRRQSLEINEIEQEPSSGSDDDMTEEDEELNEPKTPEPEDSPVSQPNPQSAWRPFTFVASISNIITSPFRSKAPIAPVEPFIFNQPPASPVARPKRMPQTERKRIVRDNGKGRLVPRTERPKRHRDYTAIPIQNRGILTPAQIAQIQKDQDDYARKMGHPNADLQSTAREKRRAVNFDRDESTSLARAQLATPAKTGEKRGVNGDVRSTSKKPWNLVHDLPSSDESDDEIDSPTPCPSTTAEKAVKQHHFGLTSIYRPAGPQNRLTPRQLQEQQEERERGNLSIPREELNNLDYLKHPEKYSRDPTLFDKPIDRKQLEKDALNPNYDWEHNPFANTMPKKKNLFAQQEQQRKAQEAKRNAEDPTAQSQKSTKSRSNLFQVPEYSDEDSDDEGENGKEVAEGSRILEPKQWTQVPPPKPRPGNAQLPQTDLAKTAQADPNQKEAIQHAIQNANRHAPRKPSNLRNMSTLSPLQVEQQEREKQLSKGKGKGKEAAQYPWSFEPYEFNLEVFPEVLAAIDEAEKDRFLPMTPIPADIWDMLYEEEPKKSEAVLAAERIFDEIEARRENAFMPEQTTESAPRSSSSRFPYFT